MKVLTLTKLYSFRLIQFKKRVKEVTFFKCDKFFLMEIKGQWDRGGGRILLGDNTSYHLRYAATSQVPVCWTLDFTWSPLHVHTYTIFIWMQDRGFSFSLVL